MNNIHDRIYTKYEKWLKDFEILEPITNTYAVKKKCKICGTITVSNVMKKCCKTNYNKHKKQIYVNNEIKHQYTKCGHIVDYKDNCTTCRICPENKRNDKFIKILEKIGRFTLLERYKNEHKANYKILVRCNFCGHEIRLPKNHLDRLKGSCPNCKHINRSLGEKNISNILDKLNIQYSTEYTFSDLKHKHKLRFDFAIFKNDHLVGLIEFDGKQHFEPIDYFGGEEGYLKTKERDILKNQYCIDNNVPLLRIRYDCINVKDLINDFIMSTANKTIQR